MTFLPWRISMEKTHVGKWKEEGGGSNEHVTCAFKKNFLNKTCQHNSLYKYNLTTFQIMILFQRAV